jgi:hypothetical protein
MSNEKEQGPVLKPAATPKTVYVSVPASLAFNYDKMQGITKTVLGKLGCLGCHSGFDLRFNNENIFVFNEKGELGH